MPSFPSPDRLARRARLRPTRRWAWVVVLSIAVHLLLLDALPRLAIAPAGDEPVLVPLHARLMPTIQPPAPTAMPAPTPMPTPPVPGKPARPTRPRPVVAPRTPEREEAFVPEGVAPVPQVQAQPAIGTDGQGSAATPPASPVTVPDAAPPVPDTSVADAAPAAAPPPVTVTPPLSARLEYKVVSQNVREANPIYGNGTITWSTADGRYRIALDATFKAVFFNVGLLTSRSEGAIGAAGLAPDRYTEKAGFRSVVATNFNRDDRQSVTFSASAASVPLAPGVQDRLSILFQIGGLRLADPSRAAAGTRIEVPVANVRNEVERWGFTCLGAETIDSGVGPLATTHFQRTPRPGSNDRTLDLWVADEGGYPARVRYTEPNGSTITMTLDRIGAVE